MTEPLFFEDVELGQPLPTLSVRFTHEDVAALVKLWTPTSGPSHFDSQEEAERSGFERPIVPDHLSIAHLGNMVLAWAENLRLLKLDAISRRVMFDNDCVTCSGLVIDKGISRGQPVVHADISIENDRDERPVTASALISVPRRSAQEDSNGLENLGNLESLASRAPSNLTPAEALGINLGYNRDLIGVERDVGEVAVTEEMLVQYARAVGATNPIYWDPAAARQGPFSGLVALPTFCSILGRRDEPRRGPDLDLSFGSRGQQATLAVENYRPIRPGDVLILSSTLQDVYAKTGRSGILVFAVYEDCLYDQGRQKVATIRHSSVRF